MLHALTAISVILLAGYYLTWIGGFLSALGAGRRERRDEKRYARQFAEVQKLMRDHPAA